MGVRLEGEVGAFLETFAVVVADDMAAHVRRTKGGDLHLADDIKVGALERHGRTLSIKVGPSKRTGWRAKFLEFGTRLMTARPFVRPARDRIKPILKPKMRDKLAKVVK